MTFRKWFDEAGIELIAQAAGRSGQCESRGNGCILPAYSPSLFRFLVKYIMMQSTRKSASVPMSRLPDSIVSRR